MAGKKAKAKARKEAAPPKAAKKEKPNWAVNFGLVPKGAAVEGTKFDFFEIKPSPGKGLGAFARRSIKAGTQIFKEQPLMVIQKHHSQISEPDVVSAYLQLSGDGRAVFDTMRNSHGRCGCKSGLFFGSIFGLELGATGVYPISSRLNHSCQANCAIAGSGSYPEKAITVLRDVEAGDELTFQYVQNVQYMTTEQRRELFESDSFDFTCACDLCTLPAVDRFSSDCRRRIMRQLLFWMGGEDLGEVAPAKMTPSPGELSETGLASILLLFAQLAAAEGTVAGDRPGLSFVKLVLFVLFKARSKKLIWIPPTTVQNIRSWWEKASKLGAGGSQVAFFDRELWHQAANFVQHVADDGKIDWKALQFKVPDDMEWLDLCQGRVFMMHDCRELKKFGFH